MNSRSRWCVPPCAFRDAFVESKDVGALDSKIVVPIWRVPVSKPVPTMPFAKSTDYGRFVDKTFLLLLSLEEEEEKEEEIGRKTEASKWIFICDPIVIEMLVDRFKNPMRVVDSGKRVSVAFRSVERLEQSRENFADLVIPAHLQHRLNSTSFDSRLALYRRVDRVSLSFAYFSTASKSLYPFCCR